MNKELFERFDLDVIYDCHSLGARVSRSEAAKEIIAKGASVISEIADHIKNYKPPTAISSLAEVAKHAWGILLSWLCEKHELDSKGLSRDNFDGWVKWTEEFSLV